MTFRRPLAARVLPPLLFLLLAALAHAGADTAVPPRSAPADQAPSPHLTVTAVGDIMPSSSFPSRRYLSTIPDEAIQQAFAGLFKGADIRFGNLEGAMAGDAPCLKSCKNPTQCYAFNIPAHYADILGRAGFNLLSLANNHISDFGQPGRERTVHHLTQSGIACGGTLEKPWDILFVNGQYVGFAAFAPHKGVADLLDRGAAVRRIKKLNALCDVVVVSIHGGAEGTGTGHVPRQEETYLGENRGDVHAFAHAVVDAGADLVLGHGPHVVRGMELYKGRLIAYSLGNFFTWARFNLEGPKGIATVLTVSLGADGRFIGGGIRSYRQPYRGLPTPDPKLTAAKEAARLSREDFPESPLRIAEDGRLTQTGPAD